MNEAGKTKVDANRIPGAVCITIDGELTGENLETTLPVLRWHLIDSCERVMILDCTMVYYMDPGGIEVLMVLNKEVKADGCRLIVVPSESMRGVISLTHLDGIVTFASNVEEASVISNC